MRRFVVGLFAAIGIVVVLAVAALGVAVWQLAAIKPSLPDNIVLSADLSRGLTAGASQDALAELVFGGKQTLRGFLDALERGGEDPRVRGLYARLGGDTLGLATCQEVRDAVRNFRAKGKFAIGFADSFGEFGPGTRPYYLATAFDEIWLQPLGSVGLIGLHSELPFFRGALDKLGIVPSFAHREEYKTATNALTETAMTAPQREQVEDLLNASEGQIVRGIAAARNLPEERVAALIDRGPFVADEALAAHLVDRIGYRDEALAQARQRAGAGGKSVALKRYLDAAGQPHDSGPKIALIYATGLITTGDSTASPLFGSAELSARKLARAFRQAAGDKEVRAILFRIDSPGGSAVASETIWREVVRARERGKPVIVSMGAVAGSGGYYIAAPADKIVAEPATLTGSIGILAGKLVVGDLMKKLGVTDDTAQRGANAAMFSWVEDFSPAGRERLDAFLDAVYHGFKAHVAEGRHLSDAAVEAAAKLTVFPREKTTIEAVYDRLFPEDGEGSGTARTAASGALSLLSGMAALVGDRGLMQMPPIGEIK